jgi:hypothetical protein
MEPEMNWSVSTKIGSIEPQACPDRAIAFIRALYPVKTAEHVAADIGLPVHTVKRWLEGVAKPSWSGLSRLIFAYGPAFLIAVYPKAPKWLDEAHRRERLAALEAEQARIRAEIAELV